MRDQLREKRSPRDFADWFFDIEPFGVTYTLEYDQKDLKYLSPGEKGIVLLLLYLEAEEDDHRPLTIDQPDDNLDNLSIFPRLVNYFRERKHIRQIVIITHNPNLVVTTDSEQIIICNFDGSRAPRVQYRSGALENTSLAPDEGIREEVCCILEGASMHLGSESIVTICQNEGDSNCVIDFRSSLTPSLVDSPVTMSWSVSSVDVSGA